MADFPNGIYNPATKSNGQVIQASYFNDPDAEITAIETGYLTGTARLNSSHSTVAALSVSGGSTFAGNASFAGDVTIAGNLLTGTAPAVRVRNSAGTAVANGASVGLSFDTQDFMTTAGMHSTSVNSSRLTVPSTGVYVIGAQVVWSAGSTAGRRTLTILRDDADVVALTESRGSPNAADEMYQTVATMWYASVSTNSFVVRVAQTSGSTASMQAVAHAPSFWMTKIR